MIKKYIIKKNYEFQNIIIKGFILKTNVYFIYYMRNDLFYSRVGISVSKKLGNAVIRNRIKRQIRSMLRVIDFNKKNYDYVIIVKKGYLFNKFLDNRSILLKLLINV